ncbi:MAG: RcpC/CpaB family pilus assembly protein [Acidimicrobiia bacterium]|nr:RcpC/CpaB family pilus assembly protein [Acidimicrobiia bacterium]
MRRRVWGVIGAVLLAVVGTIVLVAYVNGAEDRALAGEAVVDVLVVKEPVPAGTPASELGDRVGIEEVAAKVEAEGAVIDTAELGDRVASTDLVPGEQVVDARFVEPNSYRSRAAVTVPEGLLEVTVGLEAERAVGGVLAPGATVAVVASFDPFDVSSTDPVEVDGVVVPPSGKTPNSTHIVLHKVLVTNVQLDGRVGSSDDGDDETAAGEPGEAPAGRLLVTLALNAPSVERVVFAAEHGFLWLALEPATADEAGTRVQTRGTVYQ